MQILESIFSGKYVQWNEPTEGSNTKHLLPHLLMITFSSSDYNFFCETEITSEHILHFVEQV